MATELEREREALTKADTDIAEGQDRMDRQAALIADMQSKGLDTAEGERLLALLDQTLAHWERHRVMIVERIAYLEGKCGARTALPGSHKPAGTG